MDALNKFELCVDKLYWYKFLLQQHALLSIFLRSHGSKQEKYFRHESISELATSHNTTCITSEHHMPLFAANYSKLKKREPMGATKWNLTHDDFSCFLWNLRFILSDSHKKLSLVLLQIALEKCKKECVMAYNILVQVFSPLNIKITQFPDWFRLFYMQSNL